MKQRDIRFSLELMNKFGSNLIGLRTKEGIDMLPCIDIVRCEASGTKSTFYLIDGRTITAQGNLAFFENKLAEWNFFRVNKSNLINVRHVQKYLKGRGGKVILTDESIVDVSTRKRNDFLNFCTTSFYNPNLNSLLVGSM